MGKIGTKPEPTQPESITNQPKYGETKTTTPGEMVMNISRERYGIRQSGTDYINDQSNIGMPSLCKRECDSDDDRDVDGVPPLIKQEYDMDDGVVRPLIKQECDMDDGCKRECDSTEDSDDDDVPPLIKHEYDMDGDSDDDTDDEMPILIKHDPPIDDAGSNPVTNSEIKTMLHWFDTTSEIPDSNSETQIGNKKNATNGHGEMTMNFKTNCVFDNDNSDNIPSLDDLATRDFDTLAEAYANRVRMITPTVHTHCYKLVYPDDTVYAVDNKWFQRVYVNDKIEEWLGNHSITDKDSGNDDDVPDLVYHNDHSDGHNPGETQTHVSNGNGNTRQVIPGEHTHRYIRRSTGDKTMIHIRHGLPYVDMDVHIPRSISEAINIDKGNGNTYWQDAVQEEHNKYNLRFN